MLRGSTNTSKTDKDRPIAYTLQDQVLAFRLATGWEVHGRWEVCKPCVFRNLISEFQYQHRNDGWHHGDFLFMTGYGGSDHT